MNVHDVIARANVKLARDPAQPVFIMVAGGSATGKSSQVLPQLLAAFGSKAVLIEQDWYQLGVNFTDKDTSLYKWDDPRNFQIERLAKDLEDMAAGKSIKTPSFDVVAVETVGERTIEPHQVIIVDGIYALYGRLKDIADYGIYVTMPLYGRFLRRLFRMLHEQKQDKPQAAFKQVFGTVLRAQRDIVSAQAKVADCVIDTSYDFSDTIARYHLQPLQATLPSSAEVLFGRGTLRFAGTREGDSYRFYIEYVNRLYYSFLIVPEYMPLLEDVDFNER